MDGVGQDVDRDVGLDRHDALMDRGGGVRAGHRRADQLARGPVDDDRHVAERGLDRVALGARREVGDELERVEAGLARRLEGDPDRGRLRVRVRRPRQGAVVGLDGLARAPSGRRARPGSGPGGCAARARPGRRSPTGRRRCAAGRRAGTASGRSCRCRSARDRGPRAGTTVRPRGGWRGPPPSSRRRDRSRARRRARHRPSPGAPGRRSGR